LLNLKQLDGQAKVVYMSKDGCTSKTYAVLNGLVEQLNQVLTGYQLSLT
jgi:hypothetical protein